MSAITQEKSNFMKGLLIPSVIGGLLGFIISQSITVVLFYKNLELSQTLELRTVLRSDIATLRSIETSLQESTKKLLDGVVTFSYDLEEHQEDFSVIKDPAVRKFASMFLGNVSHWYELGKIQKPDYLSYTRYSIPADSQIGLELAEEIKSFMSSVSDVNTSIMDIKNVLGDHGRIWPLGTKERMDDNKKDLDKSLAEINSERIVSLTEKIGTEKRRLESMLTDMEG